MRYTYWMLVFAMFALTGCQGYDKGPKRISLFNGENLEGWHEIGSNGAWSVEKGLLVCNGKKDGYAWLSTEEQYGDFELTVECRFGTDANTGVFCRAPDREGRTSMKGFETQLRDDRNDKDLTDVSGAIFSRVPGGGRFTHWPGEWNYLTILCCGRQVRITLNGHLSSSTDMDSIESMKVVPNVGYIGLQNHGNPAQFRNIQIRELEDCGQKSHAE